MVIVTRVIYHGSANIIEKPIFGRGKSYNDYGLGFYCTEDIILAKEGAAGKDHAGYANRYEIDCDGLTILNLNAPEYSILHWIGVLLQNRTFEISAGLASEAKEYIMTNFAVPYTAYDIIVGYRADDSYFSFANDFINGAISYRQLRNALYFGNLGQQFVLKSAAAFEKIRFLDSEFAPKDEWYVKREQRDKAARREYLNAERNRRQRGDIYVTQILDEEMMPGDPRL